MIRDPLAKPLFTSRLRRRALRKETERAPHILGLIAFSFILLSAILLPLILHDPHHDLIKCMNKLWREDIPIFFTSYSMNNSSLPSWVNYNGEYILGVVNARSFSLMMGIFSSFLTYFCMFYNSAIPGIYPMSPLSPQRHSRQQSSEPSCSSSSSIAMGYKMVLVNGVVFTFLTLFFLRLYLNVPF